MPTGATLRAFLLVFPALFSIINPVGGALIFNEATAGRTRTELASLARQVGIYAFAIMLGALWAGSYLLNFFGISIGALRIAGGLVVAIRAWDMLSAPEKHQERKQQQAESAAETEDVAFYPLTMPLTTGPGTISVAVALGAERPTHGTDLLWFFLGASAAAAAMALTIWVAYRFAPMVVGLLGPSGSRIVTRLMAFLLLCIGTQIVVNGVEDVIQPLLR